MPPNGPYGGFNPQASNFLQQQRFAAFQRQMQEMGNNPMAGANRTMQYPVTTSGNQVSTETLANSDNGKTVSTTAPTQANNSGKQNQAAPVTSENNLSRSSTPNKVFSIAGFLPCLQQLKFIVSFNYILHLLVVISWTESVNILIILYFIYF